MTAPAPDIAPILDRLSAAEERILAGLLTYAPLPLDDWQVARLAGVPEHQIPPIDTKPLYHFTGGRIGHLRRKVGGHIERVEGGFRWVP